MLDRVNPIDGVTVDGPVLKEPPTFVGYHRVPLRYGMTIGELAKYQRGTRLPRRLDRHPAGKLAP